MKTKQVLQNVNDAIFIADDHLDIGYVNTAAEQVLHCSSQQIIGQNVSIIFREVMGIEFYKNYSWLVEQRVVIQFDVCIEPTNSWYNVQLSPLDDGGFVLILHDINRWKTAERKLAALSHYDFLTGLANRRKIEEAIQEMVEKKVPFTLLYVSLDHLKFINQLHNHKIGDELLKSVAKGLEHLLSEKDVVGRLEGNEFVFIRTRTGNEDRESFVETVCELFNQPFVLKGFRTISIAASIGVVTCPWDGGAMEELLAYGETAMREAKRQPGTSYKLFQPHMGIDLARRMQIEQDLSGNLADLGFHFHVQPQIHAGTGQLAGVEVLARWNHPELGMLPPFEFIAIAEETGTIVHLTRHLLQEVFSYINEREARYNCRIRTAINLTPSLLSSDSFFNCFYQLLDDYDIAPELIEIEITENTELTYSEKTLQNLLACRAKGISIAIDDFGTGFSMLAYLTQFPINKIKLDKFFTQNIGCDQKSEDVLQSLIQFVLGIGCEIVAEGIETQKEADFLKDHGCAVHQGYLYDRPMMVEQFEERYLRNQKECRAVKI